jgi:PAS domain-containing protein
VVGRAGPAAQVRLEFGVGGEVRAGTKLLASVGVPRGLADELPATGDADGPEAALLQALVDHVRAPAYCTDAYTNVLSWNAAACEVFGDYTRWPAGRRNLLWLLFSEPGFSERLVDREEYAARVVRTFRSRSDSYLNDPVAIEMVDMLSRRSGRFKALWDAHDVRRADTDTLEAVVPGGRLVLTLVTLQGITSPAIRFNAYLPADTATAALLGTGEPGTPAAS